MYVLVVHRIKRVVSSRCRQSDGSTSLTSYSKGYSLRFRRSGKPSVERLPSYSKDGMSFVSVPEKRKE